MIFSSRPEPSPSERHVLEHVLERHLAHDEARPAAHLSLWRQAALEEAVAPPNEDGSDLPQAGVPRRRRGANRP